MIEHFSSESSKSIMLIDGDYFINRSYYVVSEPFISNGHDIATLFKFQQIVNSLISRYPTDYLMITFDSPGGSFSRKQLFPEYKGTRGEKDESMIYQQKLIKRIIPILGYPSIQVVGEEADDIIGSMSKQLAKNGINSIIASRDKDMMQLIEDNLIVQYDPKEHIHMDENYLMQKHGITPSQMVDFLAIVGDTADNIPGVYRCGPKTASKLLQEFGTLENIYANLDSIKGKSMKENFKNSRENAFLSKELATIKTDLKVPLNPSDFLIRDIDFSAMQELENELNLELVSLYRS